MDAVDLSQYRELFFAESHEHLDTLNQYLLELENNPENSAVVDEIFRAAHTLKGMAATMNYSGVAGLAHEMENVLSRLRSGEVSAEGQLIDLLFRCVDALQNMIGSIESGGDDVEPPAELTRQLAAYGETKPPERAYNSCRTYLISVEIAPDCLMKSARAFVVLKQLEEIGKVIKSDPPVRELEEENFGRSFRILLATGEPPSAIAEKLNAIPEVTMTACEPADVKDRQEDSPAESRAGSIFLQKRRQTVRVDIERLDRLMNLVGELVISKTRLEQIGRASQLAELSEAVEQFSRVAADLQSVVMQARMVPVEQVFNRFPRMVRGLAKELGKEINFLIEGRETELDRTVIDEIGDPLVHLLRNAVDHGIEKPQERLLAGKPAEGTIRLAARHEGNRVVIEVADDGRGIDPEKIRASAVAKGLISPEEAKLLDRDAVLDIIFRPGFSTAEEITDISGRGVGMDVVKAKIESLNGSIGLETHPGKGTKFKISLPLTLAIIQALLVRVGREVYAVPLSSVDETIRLEDIKRVHQQEVVVLRGSVLPVVRVRRLLNVPGEEGEELYAVVVRKGDKRVGLVVDSLIGQQEVVIKSLGKLLAGVPGLAGAAVLGSGEVSLILDVGSLSFV